MRNNKLLIVQPALPNYRIPLFNGISEVNMGLYVTVLASRCDENGVVSTTDGAKFSYKIASPSKHFLGFSWQPLAVREILGLRRGDFLVVCGNPRYVFNILAAFFVRLFGVKVVWWGQLQSANTTKASLGVKIKLMRHFNAVVLYNEMEAKKLFRLTKMSNVFYINNGIFNKEIIKLREPYDARVRGKRILFIGRLTPKSKFYYLLEAMRKVKDVSLDVIGGEPSVEDVQYIQRNSLSSRIRFHGLVTDEAEISSIANKCLLFVYPGAVGLSLIHAFNYGLPAIIHNKMKQHMPEAVAFKEGENGISFEKDNVDSLAEKVSLLANSADELNSYSKSAIEFSRHEYNTDSMVKYFISSLNTLRYT